MAVRDYIIQLARLPIIQTKVVPATTDFIDPTSHHKALQLSSSLAKI
jgi:hypothetical protein